MRLPARSYVLTVCAASKDGPDGLLWICTLEPGHNGPHYEPLGSSTWNNEPDSEGDQA